MPKLVLGFNLSDQETGIYIKRAFESLQWDIIEACPRSNPPAIVKNLTYLNRPDLVLISRELSLIPYIKDIKRFSPVVCWNLDVWDSVRRWQSWFPLFREVNAYFTIAKSYIPEYKRILGHDHVFWLSEACDPTIHRKHELSNLSKNEIEEFTCDVGFVGSIEEEHPQGKFRRKIIDVLARKGFLVKLWGGGTKAIRYLKNEDLAKMSSVAKIVLCASGWPEVDISQSARIY